MNKKKKAILAVLNNVNRSIKNNNLCNYINQQIFLMMNQDKVSIKSTDNSVELADKYYNYLSVEFYPDFINPSRIMINKKSKDGYNYCKLSFFDNITIYEEQKEELISGKSVQTPQKNITKEIYEDNNLKYSYLFFNSFYTNGEYFYTFEEENYINDNNDKLTKRTLTKDGNSKTNSYIIKNSVAKKFKTRHLSFECDDEVITPIETEIYKAELEKVSDKIKSYVRKK